jgi:succinate dehydrogenase hydrophobic anchor subunit
VADDYIHSPGKRTAFKATLYTLSGILLIMGTAVLVTFDGAV